MIDADLHFIDSHSAYMDFREWLGQRRDRIAYDVETTGVNMGCDTVRLAQIGDRDAGWAFPCEGTNSWYGAFAEAMRDIGQGDVPIYAHNAIFDSSFATRDGWAVPQRLAEDTMVMAQLNDSRYAIGLKPMARRLVDRDSVAGQAVLDAAYKRNGWDWRTVPVDFPPYWAYGALDPVLTCRLAEKLEPLVFPTYRQSYEIEMGAIHVLRDARLAGMRVDCGYAHRMSVELGEEMEALEPQIPVEKPGSDKQVVAFLQERGCELFAKTEKGNWSTDDDVLKHWEHRVPECTLLRRWRKCQKLKSSYFDNLLGHQVDGVVRPDIRVLGAQKTGRMSITAPALQTLPKSAIGRNAFLAREGHSLVMADYSGVEMRILADRSGDENLLKVFREGIDQHSWTASQIYGVPIEQVGDGTPERDRAKGAGFGKVYGSGIDTFASQAGLEPGAAREFIETYDRLFPGVKAFQERVIDHVRDGKGRKWGSINTAYGRRLYVEKELAYKGVNYDIQGTAGEVLKDALCRLDAAGLGEFIRLPIHDEVIFEAPDDVRDDVEHTVAEVMPERERFAVPLEVDIKHAKRWGHAYMKEGDQPIPEDVELEA